MEKMERERDKRAAGLRNKGERGEKAGLPAQVKGKKRKQGTPCTPGSPSPTSLGASALLSVSTRKKRKSESDTSRARPVAGVRRTPEASAVFPTSDGERRSRAPSSPMSTKDSRKIQLAASRGQASETACATPGASSPGLASAKRSQSGPERKGEGQRKTEPSGAGKNAQESRKEIDDLFADVMSVGKKDGKKKTEKNNRSETGRSEAGPKKKRRPLTFDEDMGLNQHAIKRTADGLRIYTEEELGIGKGGGTPDCPFDCSCCF